MISFETERAAEGPFAQRVRVQGGDGKRSGDGFYKWQSWTSGRSGDVSGTLSISQFKADGFRQHSAGEFRLEKDAVMGCPEEDGLPMQIDTRLPLLQHAFDDVDVMLSAIQATHTVW